MWAPQYDIIVETLTGSEFEVTVTDKDTVGYIKSRIQKYEGIPVGQQHLLYNHKELSDATEMKDIPLASGSRLKLVLDMKGGPVSARRLVNLPDYENWLDLSDVLNTSRHDPLTISTPGVKLLVYKDCKKNVNRVKWVKDNLQTLQKMHQLRTKLELKRKNKDKKCKKQTGDNEMCHDKMTQDETKSERNDRLDILSNNFTSHDNEFDLDACLRTANKKDYVPATKSKYFTFERINTHDYSMQATRRTSSGLLNKYGLNKTYIRPPSLILQPKKDFFQLNTLSPLSPPPPSYNPLNKSLDIDSPQAKYPSQNVKNFKSTNCTTKVFINRPKCKSANGDNLNISNCSSYNKNEINICSEETRSKLRENIRRNRSFKTIDTSNLLDDIGQKPYNINTSLSSVLDQLFGSISCKKNEKKSSKSVQDLIEKLSSTKLGQHKTTTTSGESTSASVKNDFSRNQKFINTTGSIDIQDREIKLQKISNCMNSSSSNHNINNNNNHNNNSTATGFENKLFIDRQQTIGLNSIDATSCASDFKLDNSSSTTNSALDGPFRLYKMSSEAKNNYELPKLLIREDSPVESFHSSDPQLETLTIRGESPKNVIESYPKLSSNETNVDTSGCSRETKSNKTIIKSPWNHHHSDLGLNNLELNFLNEEYSDIDAERSTDSSSCLDNSVLKIASNLEINSSWNTSSELELDGKSQPSTTSLNFINGDLTSSDEEDVFNSSCCMLHSNTKSKSIELNEFRMMFGSSPTLLNTNYNSVTHTSRLDAIPIQYRRGYTNLNDACLSSSTSDLELFNGVRKKNSLKSASQELPSSFSRHRTTNGSLDFVRSYENLDRTKILRMKNDRSRNVNITDSDIGNNAKYIWENGVGNKRCPQSSIHSNFSTERLQEEDLCGDDYSYSNLGYDNVLSGGASGSITTSPNDCLPIGFPSDESLFNMNLDDISLLPSSFLNDRLPSSSNNSKETSRSSLILSEFDIDGISMFKKTTSNKGDQVDNKSSNSQSKNQSQTVPSAIVKLPSIIPEHTVGAALDQPVASTSAATTSTTPQKSQDNTEVNTSKTTNSGKKNDRLRCAECNKKLGLIMIMKCHCEKVFCPQHRYAEAHNCSYNFKSEGKKIIARENPLVVAQKLPKI